MHELMRLRWDEEMCLISVFVLLALEWLIFDGTSPL